MGFSIDVRKLYWVMGDADDPHDLCLHGDPIVRIGERTLEDDELSVSAAALYLLRSLTEDHIAGGEDERMIPCCGHFMMADDALENVTIVGCPNGIDWSVRHRDSAVVLSLEDGTEERVSEEGYREEVFRFADKIEAYYRSCADKVFDGDEDDFAKNGYTAFWNEWHRRRGAGATIQHQEG
ncbi:MAG: hypothetical protein IJR14_03180 [Synergistaceae bacterium]|nr:hypothetical protein [Synergistaceae bacterium]